MGLDLFLGPLIGKFLGPLLAGAAALVALLLVYFGIKRKGAREAEDRFTRDLAETRQEQQQKVDEARGQDATIDAETRVKLEKAAQKHAERRPEPPSEPPAPGKSFQLAFPLVLALGATLALSACVTRPFSPPPPVAIDIPARPILPSCPPAPHPTGSIIQTEAGLAVALSMPDAQAVAGYLREAPGCFERREILLDAALQKLENRLRAVGGR